MQQRAGAALRLCPALHAKYYRVDTVCLVGSANITGAALGWSAAPNLEILTPFHGDAATWQAFERQILAQSVPCTESDYQQVKALAALLQAESFVSPFLTGEPAAPYHTETPAPEDNDVSIETLPIDRSRWLPQSRQPADLYLAYSGQSERLTAASRTTAFADLAALQIPPGFPEAIFVRYVGMQLLQTPCITSVDKFVIQSQRFGTVKAYLQTLPCSQEPHFDAARAWQTLMRWLLHFLPERYEYSVPRHSEVFQRRI